MEPTVRTLHGQESWCFGTDTVQVAVTQRGGMMGPVTFYADSRCPVEPYYVSPWQDEGRPAEGAVTDTLRGDFFCLPFGWPSTYHGVSYDPHGEPSYRSWSEPILEASGDVTTMRTELETSAPAGRISKQIGLREGENALYISHRLTGFDCAAPVGHHAILDCTHDNAEWVVSTSPIAFGMTDGALPFYQFSGMYHSLAPLARFNDLKHVPTIWRDMPTTDCTRFPARPGFVDHLELIAAEDRGPDEERPQPAWTAAVGRHLGVVWFSLKDPAVLPGTLIWLDNGGRHDDPFLGRNVALGLEEVCAYFASGYAASARQNLLNKLGVPTTVRLTPESSTDIRTIQGCVRVPPEFDRVAEIEFQSEELVLRAESGSEARAPVRTAFLFDGTLSGGGR